MLRTDLIRPLPAVLRENATRYGDRIAFADSRRAIEYAELERRTGRLGGNLRCDRGDRVALMLGNSVEMVEGYLAVARAGAVGVPINPYCSDVELEHILLDSGATVLLAQHVSLSRRREVLAAHPGLRVIAAGPGAEAGPGFEELASTEPDRPARDDLEVDEVGWILYTSGTTGLPKGVPITLTKALWGTVAGYVPWFGMNADDRLLWPIPLSHCMGHHLGVLGALAVGASVRLIDGFAAGPLLDALRTARPTILVGVPTMFHRLIQACGTDRIPAAELRACWFGGASGSVELGAAVQAALGVPLLNTYGATEACGPITVNPPSSRNSPVSAGVPVLGTSIRIVEPIGGVDVPAGAEGELWVCGPGIMAGYHNRPDLTAEVMHGEWFRTGDLARRDRLGFVEITGRIKELLVRGGENIHPAEIENVVKRAPGVRDAAVCGLPHDTLGEVPVALVVPGDESFDAAALLAVCRAALSHTKVPMRVYAIDEVPRTASGKIIRTVLPTLTSRLLLAAEPEAAKHADDWVRADPLVRESLAARLAAGSAADGAALLCEVILNAVGEILGAHPRRVDEAFRDWGLTSLGAVALRNRLTTATGADLPVTAIFDYPTPQVLAEYLRSSVQGETPAPAVPAARRPEPGSDPADAAGARPDAAAIAVMDAAELVRLAAANREFDAADGGERNRER